MSDLTVPGTKAGSILDETRNDASLSTEQLWLRHVELGGTATLAELRGFLVPGSVIPQHEHDVIAHALNERMWELDRNPLVRYADPSTPGTGASVTVDAPRAPTISVVIPTLNEAKNLPYVLRCIPDDVAEIIVVDGRSKDDTIAVARSCRPDVKIVLQDGRGKGNALGCGFRAVTSDITVMIDADGSTDPAEIPRYVDALVDGADIAMGSRFTEGGGSDDMTFLRRMGNKVLTLIVNVVWRQHYTDLCYGYMAFWTRHRAVVHADTSGFEVETLMNIRAAISGLAVREIPSFEASRRFGTSNLSVVSDGARVLRTIAAEAIRPS